MIFRCKDQLFNGNIAFFIGNLPLGNFFCNGDSIWGSPGEFWYQALISNSQGPGELEMSRIRNE